MSADNIDPLMKITERGYYVAFWYLAGRNCDFLAILQRPEPGAELQCNYRFRYYNDDRVFDSEDERSNWVCDFTGTTEDRAIALVDETVIKTLVREGFCGSRLPWKVRERSWRRIIKGDAHALMRVLTTLPFIHLSQPGQPGRSLGDPPKGKGN